MEGGEKNKSPAMPQVRSRMSIFKRNCNRKGSIEEGWRHSFIQEEKKMKKRHKNKKCGVKAVTFCVKKRHTLKTNRKCLRHRNSKGRHVQKLEFGSVKEVQPNILDLIPEEDLVGFNHNIHCLRLSKEAQELMGCVIGKDLTVENNWKYIAKYVIIFDIINYMEDSQFFHIYGPLEESANDLILIIYDKTLNADHLFICLDPLAPIPNLNSHVTANIYSFVCIYRIKYYTLMRFFINSLRITEQELEIPKALSFRPLLKVSVILDNNYLITQEVILSSVEIDSESEMMLTWVIPIYNNSFVKERDVKVVKEICGYKHIEGMQISCVETQDVSTQTRYPCIEDNMSLYGTYDKVIENSKLCDKIYSFGIQDYMQMDFYTGNLHGFRHTRQASKKIALIPEGEPLLIDMEIAIEKLRKVKVT